MVANFIQANSTTPPSTSGGTSITCTFPSAQTAGNCNIIAIGWSDISQSVTSVVDSKGNSYSVAVAVARSTGTNPVSQMIYYAPNIVAATAGANTVTVTFGAAPNYPDVRILEYQGLHHTSPFDVGASNSAATGRNASVGPITTSYPNELLFAAGVTSSAFTSSAPSGWTQRQLTGDGDISEDSNAITVGSYSATATLSSGGPWLMQIAAFRVGNAYSDSANRTVTATATVTGGQRGVSDSVSRSVTAATTADGTINHTSPPTLPPDLLNPTVVSWHSFSGWDGIIKVAGTVAIPLAVSGVVTAITGMGTVSIPLAVSGAANFGTGSVTMPVAISAPGADREVGSGTTSIPLSVHATGADREVGAGTSSITPTISGTGVWKIAPITEVNIARSFQAVPPGAQQWRFTGYGGGGGGGTGFVSASTARGGGGGGGGAGYIDTGWQSISLLGSTYSVTVGGGGGPQSNGGDSSFTSGSIVATAGGGGAGGNGTQTAAGAAGSGGTATATGFTATTTQTGGAGGAGGAPNSGAGQDAANCTGVQAPGGGGSTGYGNLGGSSNSGAGGNSATASGGPEVTTRNGPGSDGGNAASGNAGGGGAGAAAPSSGNAGQNGGNGGSAGAGAGGASPTTSSGTQGTPGTGGAGYTKMQFQ